MAAPRWLLALLAPALVLATRPTCTNIDFQGAELAVSNLGGARACCNFCSYDSSRMCCPAKDEAGDVTLALSPSPLLSPTLSLALSLALSLSLSLSPSLSLCALTRCAMRAP